MSEDIKTSRAWAYYDDKGTLMGLDWGGMNMDRKGNPVLVEIKPVPTLPETIPDLSQVEPDGRVEFDPDTETVNEEKPLWECRGCGQLNNHWSKVCGRCSLSVEYSGQSLFEKVQQLEEKLRSKEECRRKEQSQLMQKVHQLEEENADLKHLDKSWKTCSKSAMDELHYLRERVMNLECEIEKFRIARSIQILKEVAKNNEEQAK